jgi:hypothetical protein
MPNVRDDRETPLCAGRDVEIMEVIWVKREGAIFLQGGLDSESVICPTGEFVNDVPIINAVVMAGLCPGHPRLSWGRRSQDVDARTRPGTTIN